MLSPATPRAPTTGSSRRHATSRATGWSFRSTRAGSSEAERIAADLADLALPFETAHAEKAVGAQLSEGDETAIERLEGSALIASRVGARLLVLHLWELPLGDRYLERNLELLPSCADVAERHGLTLGIETIPCSVGSPLANVAKAVEREPRCVAVLDTEFLALHGELDAAPAAGLPVGHVHVKDFEGEIRHDDPRRRYLLPGEGALDLDGFLRRLATDGYEAAATLEASAVDPEGGLDHAPSGRYCRRPQAPTLRAWLLTPAGSRSSAAARSARRCSPGC